MNNIHFHHPLSKAKCLALGDEGFGDEFMKGNITIDGNLADFIEGNSDGALSRWVPYIRSPRSFTGQHYDIAPDFYKIMLGNERIYTCGNYDYPDINLAQAQRSKQLQHTNWLNLTGTERVLECGFGWGNLSQYIGEGCSYYHGLTVSEEQQQIAKATNQYFHNEYHLSSWNRHNYSASYDRFTSICMLEHVGIKHMSEFVQWISDSLVHGGIGTLQFISRDKPISEWADKHIFPGAEPPQLNMLMRLMKQNNLSVTHYRERGDDYVRTLTDWLANVENNAQAITALGMDDQFIRIMQLYLSGGIVSFRTGASQLIQLRFEKR